ncbi:MAG: hypothetical protein AABW59_03015 [archaeon]
MSWATNYDYGVVFIGKDYNGLTISQIKNKVLCNSVRDSTPFESGTVWRGEMISNSTIQGVFYINPALTTYAGDGLGSLLVRSDTEIREYISDSNDIEYPSAIRGS